MQSIPRSLFFCYYACNSDRGGKIGYLSNLPAATRQVCPVHAVVAAVSAQWVTAEHGWFVTLPHGCAKGLQAALEPSGPAKQMQGNEPTINKQGRMKGEYLTMVTRRELLRYSAIAGAAALVPWQLTACMPIMRSGLLQQDVKSAPLLDPRSISKYQAPLVIPPAMPMTTPADADAEYDYYEIAVRQFQQQLLPPGLPTTTVWGLGSRQLPGMVEEGGSFNYPSFTIEATLNRPVRVKWINELMDDKGNYLPHLLPVDQTLHRANPPGGSAGRDGHSHDPMPYRGPVPMVIHLHGAHTTQENDGYAEAWYLPAAENIPAGYATTGTYYDIFKASSPLGSAWEPGAAVFQYPNDQHAMTSWYHDHTLGITRTANVMPVQLVSTCCAVARAMRSSARCPAQRRRSAMRRTPSITNSPLPFRIEPSMPMVHFSIPPSAPSSKGWNQKIQIPFTPDLACGGAMSDVAPLEPRVFWRYHCRQRPHLAVSGGGTAPLPVSPAQRLQFAFSALDHEQCRAHRSDRHRRWSAARPRSGDKNIWPQPSASDVIVDFTAVPEGTEIMLLNLAPDEPFGGGRPGVDYERADPDTTGQIMQFRVTAIAGVTEHTANGAGLPALPPLPAADAGSGGWR